MSARLTLHAGMLAGLIGVLAPAVWAASSAPAPERQQTLSHLLRQECGSCHGLHLNGGLGPALTASALAGRRLEQIASTILNGRPGTAMPGWRPFLDESEAQWLAEHLLNPNTPAFLP